MVSFGEAIKLGFNGYVKFSGRSTRAEYWWWFLFYNLVGMGASTLDRAVFPVFSLIIGLAFFLPNLAVSVRRLHDINRTGWWLFFWFLIMLVPTIIIIVGFFTAFESIWEGNWDETGSWMMLILGVVLIVIISLLIFIWWIIWFVKQGDFGPNKYGLDPRGESVASVPYNSGASSLGETIVEKAADDSTSGEIYCPICNLGNRSGSKFCKQCGASLDNVT